MAKVNVLPNGRIVLPIELRRRLGVEKGGQIVAECDGDVVRLSTPDRSLDEAGALFRALMTSEVRVTGETASHRSDETGAATGGQDSGGQD